jgi:hypothetical protein
MEYDSTLLPILLAASYMAAGSPTCYGTHFSGYSNVTECTDSLADRIITEYSNFLMNAIFLKEKFIKSCGFNRYCCIAYNIRGLLKYEFVIDNGLMIEYSTEKEWNSE